MIKHQEARGINTDQLILEMIRENDEYAFVLLYKKYWHLLLNFAGNYLNDRGTCEEITQNLFVELHARRNVLKINSSLSSYLHTSIRNRIFNHMRNRSVYRKHITIASNTTTLTQNNVEQFIDLKEIQQEINSSLNGMPSKCREVYLLQTQDNLTVKNISALLGRPVDTVEKQLRRAKRYLQVYLSGYNRLHS